MSSLRLSLSLITPIVSLASLAPLPACNLGERATTGDCPDDEMCSGDTPRGLHFEGAELGGSLLPGGPLPTLAGGTQHLRLTYDPGDGSNGALRDLDRPYIADDDGGAGVRVERTNGPIVTLRGVASQTNYLRITDLDGALYDRKQLQGAAFLKLQLLPGQPEQILPGDAIVFAPGARDITVALLGQPAEGGIGAVRAVDESMKIELSGATRKTWDTIRTPALAAGLHAVQVTAGDRPAARADVEVVAGADEIVQQPMQAPLVVGSATMVCFSARAAGRHVAGLAWTFASDNGTATQALLPNCAAVKAEHVGAVNVTATAGGRTLATPLTAVITAGAAAPATIAAEATARREAAAIDTTAGERAAAQQ
ncbi:MAG TPA: hypothetical protein VNO30_42765 [Kofleriaceae bacterium]|nr:hypothetical protein [Kofleriaceae bacterium]